MAPSAKLLIIDDEEYLRENLKYVFEKKGYAVALAADGVEGLKALETCTPDLILLDLNMPNMGGVEFFQRICDGDRPKVPVLILTARAAMGSLYKDFKMEQFFRDFNVDGVMSKPFELQVLVDTVAAIIDKNANAGAVPPTNI